MTIKNNYIFDSDQDNDLEKIELCQSGNNEAFSFLVEKYKNLVYKLALRMTGNYHDSEDIAQESFLRAYRSLHQYNPKYSFSSWLYKITLNIIRDRMRKKDYAIPFSASHPEQDPEAMANPIFPGDDALTINPEERQIQQENINNLQSAINILPLPHREIIILRHIQNLSYYEISRVLNIPVNSVKVRLHRARVQLKDLLEKK
jgi:RNA polymerase sigma-70 factor (ECF subfamily)